MNNDKNENETNVAETRFGMTIDDFPVVGLASRDGDRVGHNVELVSGISVRGYRLER